MEINNNPDIMRTLIENIMSLSDEDFINFYQDTLRYLWEVESDYVLWLTGSPKGRHDVNWYNKSLDALTRMELSNLITSENNSHDMLTRLANTTDIDIWIQYIFDLTSAGRDFMQQFEIADDLDENPRLIPGFREALIRIFDEHGVGFDVELPYKSCVTAP